MPVATDLAELLRKERGLRREPVELRRRDRNAVRAKRQDDARNSREIIRDRLLVRAEHLPQVGLQGLSRSRDGPRRRGRTRKPPPDGQRTGEPQLARCHQPQPAQWLR